MTRDEITLAELSTKKQALKNDLENFISRKVAEFEKSTDIQIKSIKVQLNHACIPSYYVIELKTNIDKNI